MAEYVGRSLAKQFPNYGKKRFKGTVASVSEVEGTQIFRIEYEDGDAEELELFELEPWLQPVGKTASVKRKGAEALAPAASSEEEEPYITTAVPGAEEGAAKRHSAGKGSSKNKAAAAPTGSRPAQRPSSSVGGEDIVRHPLLRQEAGQALCSQSTVYGGTCYVSSIRPTTTQQLDDGSAEEQAAEYDSQAANVLEQLEATLQSAGSSKDHLLSVTVLLKDIELGSQPWATAWNRWCNHRHLPAALIKESFLGSEGRLVAVSAIAALR